MAETDEEQILNLLNELDEGKGSEEEDLFEVCGSDDSEDDPDYVPKDCIENDS